MYRYLALVLFAVTGNAIADDTVVDVAYSHRQVSDTSQPDPEIVEGSIVTIFSANNPIYLVEPDTTMVRISDTEFQYLFVWNETRVKTVTFRDDQMVELEVTAFPEPVYPFNLANHTVPVVNIITDPANLWDPEIGIYVWGNHENCLQHGEAWERLARFDFYDVDDNLIITRDVGLRINGGYSRRFMQKSLRVYFDHCGPDDQVIYDFFGDQPMSFRRILLRNGRWPARLTNAAFTESVYRDLGHYASRFAPMVLYLNGEYWGVELVRERIDDEFFEHTHGFDGTDYIYVKDGTTEHGDGTLWPAFLNAVNAPQDYSSHAFFEMVDDNLDLQSYIDWLSINILGASADNGCSWNLVIFKPEGEKWEYVTWDEDACFHLANLESDHFRFLSAPNEAEFNEFFPPSYFHDWSLDVERYFGMFHNLMQNAEFRFCFSQRMDELLANQLAPAPLQQRLTDFENSLVAEMEMNSERLGWWNAQTFSSYIADLRNWISDRHPIVIAQKAAFMEFHRADVELTAFSATAVDPQVRLDWRTEVEMDNQGFIVYRSVGTPDNMVEIASYLTHPELEGQMYSTTPTLYEFWDADPVVDEVNYYMLAHVDRGGVPIFHNWIEHTSFGAVSGLAINEFLASNDSNIQDEAGDFDDWLEIYNASPAPVELGGLYLTDDLAYTTKWELPDMTIAAGGFLIVWCDDEEGEGPLHANFKLSAAGEQIGLFDRIDNGNQPIDTYTFGTQSPDISQGRVIDGGTPWIFFDTPTPGATNNDPNAVLPADNALSRLMPNHPNPFNPATTIRFWIPHAGDASVRVFDAAGRRIDTLLAQDVPAGWHTCTWNGTDDAGQPVASGVYYYQLETGRKITTKKMVLLK